MKRGDETISAQGAGHELPPLSRRGFLGLVGAGAAAGMAGGAVGNAKAQATAGAAYPSRPIKLILGFPPGGATDNSARLNAGKMSEFLGQPIVVENRPGASGMIAAEAVARSEPDGYTLFYTTSTIHGINPNVYSKLPYDPIKDFDPVLFVSKTGMVLIVRDGLEVKSTREFMELARSRPGKLTYGSAGMGSTPHLAGAMLCHAAGIDAVHVAYKGSAPAQNDLAAGQIDFMVDTISASLNFIRSGKVKPLAVSSLEPSKTLPDLPTLDAQGAKGFQVAAWGGFVVPKGTPAAVIAALNDAGNRTLSSPDFVERALGMGSELQGGTPEAFGEWIRSELANWKQAVAAAGVPRQ